MITESFKTLQNYVSNIEFKTSNVPDLFFSEDNLGNLDISIGIKPRLLDDLHYIVELHACLTSKLEEEIVTILEITYSSFGRIIDENLNAEQINEILTDVIPGNMYDPLRALVWEITSASGFTPIMMEDYNFMKNQVDLVETEAEIMNSKDKNDVEL